MIQIDSEVQVDDPKTRDTIRTLRSQLEEANRKTEKYEAKISKLKEKNERLAQKAGKCSE